MRPLVDPDTPLKANPRGHLFDRCAAAGVFVTALAIRLLYILQLRQTPLFSELRLDPLYYHDWARRIAAGDWLSGKEVFEQSPLYAYVLALIYRLFGDGLLAPRIVQAFVGAATSLLVLAIARRLLGRPAGLAAGLLMAVYAPAVFYDGMIMKTSYAVMLTAAMAAALVHSGGSRRNLLVLAGLLLGLAALVRDNLILLAPLLALWLVVDLFTRAPLGSGRATEAAARVLCLAAGVAVAVLPVTIRNYAVSGEWVLLTAGGGEVFYIGNNPEADGRYSPPRFVRATSVVEHEDFRTEAARRLGHPVTRREASTYWLAEGMHWIAANPLDYARLLGRKLLIFLNAYELPDNQNFYHHRLFVPMLRFLPTWAVLLPLAAAGIVVSFGAWRDLLPLHLIALGYTATVMLFFNFARFRMPLVPVLVVFAGEAVTEIPNLLRRGSRAAKIAALAAIGAASLLSVLPISSDPLHAGQSAAQLADLMSKSGRTDEGLAQSDAAIGLLESIYVSEGGRLADGGHGVARLADPSRPGLGASYYGILMEAYAGRARIARSRARSTGTGRETEESLLWLARADAAAPDADIGFVVFLQYGEALLDAGRVAEAIEPLALAHGQEPSNLHAALFYAQAVHRDGRPRDALKIVETALDANPHPQAFDLADANFGLALIYRDLGDIPRMKFHLRETLNHNPNHPRAGWIRRLLAESDGPAPPRR